MYCSTDLVLLVEPCSFENQSLEKSVELALEGVVPFPDFVGDPCGGKYVLCFLPHAVKQLGHLASFVGALDSGGSAELLVPFLPFCPLIRIAEIEGIGRL